jgi:hypothetical protein
LRASPVTSTSAPAAAEWRASQAADTASAPVACHSGEFTISVAEPGQRRRRIEKVTPADAPTRTASSTRSTVSGSSRLPTSSTSPDATAASPTPHSPSATRHACLLPSRDAPPRGGAVLLSRSATLGPVRRGVEPADRSGRPGAGRAPAPSAVHRLRDHPRAAARCGAALPGGHRGVIGRALLASARGRGYQRIATDLQRPPG